MDKQTNWYELEERLGRVLASLEVSLDLEDVELIADFIDNREYEVAYTWMRSLISDRKIVLLSGSDVDLNQAASLMKLE